MDVKDLNKSQLLLLVILLSFITSIATGIATVTLLEKAPQSVTMPIDRIVRQTVDKIVPAVSEKNFEVLSDEQKNLLEDLKAIKPLTVSLYLKGDKAKNIDDKILGTGLFLGNDKIVIASTIAGQKEGQIYVVKSVLGEQKVSKITQEKDFTIIELSKADTIPTSEPTDKATDDKTPVPDTTATQINQ
ncbi:MAG: hypothetical protein M3Q34_01215 [bacterium]|nr:hypothetical protein [bacterium]